MYLIRPVLLHVLYSNYRFTKEKLKCLDNEQVNSRVEERNLLCSRYVSFAYRV